MSNKNKILIIDSTTNRREELCKLWSVDLGYDVVFSAGVDLFNFHDDTEVTLSDLINSPPIACLLHQNDKRRYDDPERRKLLDSCRRVVVFGGAGISGRGDWPDQWFWIPRAISGKASANYRQWKQLADWFSSESPLPADKIDLLSRLNEPRFLIAIHILCQGFVVGDRLRERLPTAVEQTHNRKWWCVPLVESVGDSLINTVQNEWGPDMPESLAILVKWISGETGYENIDLPRIVPAVKQEIENRLSK
jgi:hypothetical protein